MVKRYVLTGGPSSGKTSIIIALEMQGFPVIREAAEDYILLENAKGNEKPWEDKDFQHNILRIQKQRESAIPDCIREAFIDRGIADGLAYYQKENRKPPWLQLEAIEYLKKRPYDRVFLIENIGECAKGYIRRENQEEALWLERQQYENYKSIGHEVIRIANIPLDERLRKITDSLCRIS